MFGFGLLGWLSIAALVALVVWLVRRDDRGHRPADGAESILRERYARGEIDKAEFDARMRDLVQGLPR